MARLLGEKSERKERHSRDSFFEIIRPTVSFDDVILPQKTSAAINLAINGVLGDASHLLKPVGAAYGAYNQGRSQKALSLIMLFFGPPGTWVNLGDTSHIVSSSSVSSLSSEKDLATTSYKVS